MIRVRGNVLLQYSLVTLVVTAGISTVLGIVLARQTTMYEMENHARQYPEIVRLAVLSDPGLPLLLSGPAGTRPTDEDRQILQSFLTLGGVYRVKAWSPDLRIVWSDQGDLVGQSFPDNDPCIECLRSNKVVAEVVQPSGTENRDERGAGLSLEIYTPVPGPDGRQAGVIEVYEANAELFAQISKATRFVWFSVTAGGAVLYALLFVVFLQSWRRQRSASEQLLETQDATIRALARQADLRDETTGRHIEDLVKSAPLHDIGKVGVKDAILLEPGPLTAAETKEMRLHCELGVRGRLRRAADTARLQGGSSPRGVRPDHPARGRAPARSEGGECVSGTE